MMPIRSPKREQEKAEHLNCHLEVVAMKGFSIHVIKVILAAALLVSPFAGCSRSASEDETPDSSTYRPLATPATEFEQELQNVRSANFQYVWVFTRIDGKEFTPEDSKILRENVPRVVDWVGMKDKKKFIAGFNFPPEPEALAVLQKRYKIENYSVK